MSELEKEFARLQEKLEESETGRLGVKLDVDLQPVHETNEEIEEFKTVYRKLLEGNAFKRAVELLQSKLTFEKLAVTVKLIESHVSSLKSQEDTSMSNLQTLISGLNSTVTEVVKRLDSALEMQRQAHEREHETLNKIDSYLNQYV